MKRLLTLMMFGMLLGSMTGCRVCDCWRQAWNSRFHPQQQQQAVIVSEPCVVTDSCSTPCGSPCGSGGGVTTVVTPGPVPAR